MARRALSLVNRKRNWPTFGSKIAYRLNTSVSRGGASTRSRMIAGTTAMNATADSTWPTTRKRPGPVATTSPYPTVAWVTTLK